MLLHNPDSTLEHRVTVIPYKRRGLGKRLTLLSFHWAPLHQDVSRLVITVQYPSQYYDPLPPRSLVKSIKGLKVSVENKRKDQTFIFTVENASLLQFPRELFRIYFTNTSTPRGVHTFRISAYVVTTGGRRENVDIVPPYIKGDVFTLSNLPFQLSNEPKEFLIPHHTFQPGELQRYSALSVTNPKGEVEDTPPQQNVVTVPKSECSNPLSCNLFDYLISKIFEFFLNPVIAGIWNALKLIQKGVDRIFEFVYNQINFIGNIVANFAYALESINQSLLLIQGQTRFLRLQINWLIADYLPTQLQKWSIAVMDFLRQRIDSVVAYLQNDYIARIQNLDVALLEVIGQLSRNVDERLELLDKRLRKWVIDTINDLFGNFLAILADIWDFLLLIARVWRDIGGVLYLFLLRPDLIIKAITIASVFDPIKPEMQKVMSTIERIILKGGDINTGLYQLNPKTNRIEFGPVFESTTRLDAHIDELDFFTQDWAEEFISRLL